MTDFLFDSDLVAAPTVLDLRRADARRAADRHSRLVRALRRSLVAGVVLTVAGIVIVAVCDPFGRTIGGLSIAGTAIEGTKVTMDRPKLSGYQKDGRPYEIEAERAVQDLKVPGLFELHDLKARLTMADKSVTHLTAEAGAYNSTADSMVLTSKVHVVSDSGLDAVTQDATVEFKANSLVTDKPVVVTMPGKTVKADQMQIVNGGERVTFEGHVRTDIAPPPEAVAEAPGVAPPAP